jgi:hypothetical protein
MLGQVAMGTERETSPSHEVRASVDSYEASPGKRTLVDELPLRSGTVTDEELVALVTREDAYIALLTLTGRPSELSALHARLVTLCAWAPFVMRLISLDVSPRVGARDALYTLVARKLVTREQGLDLFERRFRLSFVAAAPEIVISLAELAVVWRALDALPESDISNDSLRHLVLQQAKSGGTYDASVDSVYLPDEADPVWMAHAVRHEVGHAVHDRLRSDVDGWLVADMGFVDVSLDDWVRALGGYPATWTWNGERRAFVDADRGNANWLIRSFVNRNTWNATRPTLNGVDGKDSYWKDLADDLPIGIRAGCHASAKAFYAHWREFPIAKGQHYFINHYYEKFMRFGPAAAGVIEATGDDYTAMSPAELFANAYAEYFADPRGARNPEHWGGRLPAPVKAFFRRTIVEHQPYRRQT